MSWRTAGFVAAITLVIAPVVGRKTALAADVEPLPGRVWHLKVEGDLDCARLVEETEAIIDEANRSRAGLILLELDGDGSRPDVVWGIGRAIRASDAPVCVYLNDPGDRRVGLGQLTLGVLAETCAVAPRVEIVHGPEHDLSHLAPEEADWEQIHREMSGAVYLSLKGRGADPGLSSALVAPRRDWWLVGENDSSRLSTDRPEGSSGPPVVAADGSEARVRLSDEQAVALGLVGERPANLSRLLSSHGKAGASRTERTVRSGLREARARVEEALASVDEQISRADLTLDIRPRRDRHVSDRDYAQAGRAAHRMIEDARRTLAQAEEACVAYPELLRSPPPDETGVGATERSIEWGWRRAFQSRLDRLRSLDDRARQHEMREDR